MKHRSRKSERGAVLPLLVVCIAVLLACAALAIDMGLLYTARTSAQHAADASALAAAFTFVNSPTAAQPAAAIEAATRVGDSNFVLNQPVAVNPGDVSVDLPNRRVTVTVRRTGANAISTVFARIMGINSVDVLAQATAEAGTTPLGSSCVKPVFLPNTIVSSANPPAACTSGQVMFDGNGNLTPLAISEIGQQFRIRPTSPSSSLEPSQFFSLDFGAGANDYRCALGNCLNVCFGTAQQSIRCGDQFPVKTGNMNGPTRQGVDDLIGNPPDTWVGIGQYRDSSGVVWDTSRALAVVPVWDTCAQPISPGYHGQQIRVVGFAEIFFERMQGNDVIARLVSAAACTTSGSGGSGGASPGSTATTGPSGLPVRLVQNPS